MAGAEGEDVIDNGGDAIGGEASEKVSASAGGGAGDSDSEDSDTIMGDLAMVKSLGVGPAGSNARR